MPKFLGMEPKTYLWVGGGLVAVLVLYYVVKARGGAQGATAGGDLNAGLGPTGAAPSPASYTGQPDSAGDRYAQQLNDLELQAGQEQLRQAQQSFDLQQEAGKQQLGLWGAQQSLLFQGAQKEQEISLGYEQAQYNTAKAAQDVVTRSVQGKKKVECPKGQHLVVLADGTPQCQEKGGGGFNFSTITQGIANIATGLFSGAAQAAPGIGYSAANYAAANAGVIPGRPAPSTPGFTPPIAPRAAPYARQPMAYSPATNAGMAGGQISKPISNRYGSNQVGDFFGSTIG